MLEQLCHHLTDTPNQRGLRNPPELQLLVALHYFASNDLHLIVGDTSNSPVRCHWDHKKNNLVLHNIDIQKRWWKEIDELDQDIPCLGSCNNTAGGQARIAD
ncbi:hypothetical protein Pmani_030927 [Petrolisthes manimaculis]|uniref:Uncharacterized protein n=1 Tax=Petrolisthes manimaculis TaxID=1843537 RepID=A0AAE1NUN3_9EUCA|nr:hypothetical protein Pmani_030927 [Petrolisthes manimaculis]